jgi:hypothetical protein
MIGKPKIKLKSNQKLKIHLKPNAKIISDSNQKTKIRLKQEPKTHGKPL